VRTMADCGRTPRIGSGRPDSSVSGKPPRPGFHPRRQPAVMPSAAGKDPMISEKATYASVG